MIIIAGWLDVDPAERGAYVADCTQVVQLAHDAAGCLDFSITPDTVAPGRVRIYERWETDEQLETFRGSSPSGEQDAQIRAADVRRYRISSVEDA